MADYCQMVDATKLDSGFRPSWDILGQEEALEDNDRNDTSDRCNHSRKQIEAYGPCSHSASASQ